MKKDFKDRDYFFLELNLDWCLSLSKYLDWEFFSIYKIRVEVKKWCD